MAPPLNAALALPEEQPPARKLPQPRTTPYPAEKRAPILRDIRDRGAAVVAAEIGYSVNTLNSLAAGCGVNESTKRLTDVYLANRDPA
jgi:hypothetical protein